MVFLGSVGAWAAVWRGGAAGDGARVGVLPGVLGRV